MEADRKQEGDSMQYHVSLKKKQEIEKEFELEKTIVKQICENRVETGSIASKLAKGMYYQYNRKQKEECAHVLSHFSHV